MARRQSNPKQPQGLPKGVSLRHRLRLGSTTYSVAVSSDGQRAVSGSEHGKLKVWDLESGRQVHFLEGHREDINSLVVSRDGRWAISGSGRQHNQCLGLGERSSDPVPRRAHRPCRCYHSCPRGPAIGLASLDGTPRQWDLSGPSPKGFAVLDEPRHTRIGRSAAPMARYS